MFTHIFFKNTWAFLYCCMEILGDSFCNQLSFLFITMTDLWNTERKETVSLPFPYKDWTCARQQLRHCSARVVGVTERTPVRCCLQMLPAKLGLLCFQKSSRIPRQFFSKSAAILIQSFQRCLTGQCFYSCNELIVTKRENKKLI